jgi:hypothetical protein
VLHSTLFWIVAEAALADMEKSSKFVRRCCYILFGRITIHHSFYRPDIQSNERADDLWRTGKDLAGTVEMR